MLPTRFPKDPIEVVIAAVTLDTAATATEAPPAIAAPHLLLLISSWSLTILLNSFLSLLNSFLDIPLVLPTEDIPSAFLEALRSPAPSTELMRD